jgi:transcriptional regulator with XRE-family HTH domain
VAITTGYLGGALGAAAVLGPGMLASYLSFLETGRSRPRQELVLRLSQALGIPLREQAGCLVLQP